MLTFRRVPLSAFPVRPAVIALLWVLLVCSVIVQQILFRLVPGPVSSLLHLAGTALFSAFVAGTILRMRVAALRLAAAFMMGDLAIGLMQAAALAFAGTDEWARFFIGLSAFVWWTVALCLLIGRALPVPVGRMRRAGAMAMLVVIGLLSASMNGLDDSFYYLSYTISPPLAEPGEPEPPARMDADRLWEAQPGLVDGSLSHIRPSVADTRNIYVMTVAASGRGGALFSREATLAGQRLAAHYGTEVRGMLLLSNGTPDHLRVPLATNRAIARVADGIGAAMNPDRDVAVLYLSSHGSRDATLETDLPDYQSLQAISAPSLAAALKQARIRRRVIILSACYAGSWIKPLASDDTIVIAAAAADRTSFGCDDARRLTYFGEAFLEGPLGRGGSLAGAFTAAKAKVARWEAAKHYTPSNPQVYVGRNMQAFWREATAGR